MELQALLSLTLHHCCCFDQTGSEGEKRSTPSDAYDASCHTLAVGGFLPLGQGGEERRRLLGAGEAPRLALAVRGLTDSLQCSGVSGAPYMAVD